MDVLVLALHDYAGVLCTDYFPMDRVQEEFVLYTQQKEFFDRLEYSLVSTEIKHLCVYVGSERKDWRGFPVHNMSTHTFIGLFFGSSVPKITVLIDSIIEVDGFRLPFTQDPLSDCVIHENVPKWPNHVTFHIYREPLPTELILLNDNSDDETDIVETDDPPSVRKSTSSYHIHEIMFTTYQD